MSTKLKGFGDLVNYLFWIGVASWVVFRPGGPVDDIHKYFERRFGAIDQKAGVIECKLEQNFPNPTREGLLAQGALGLALLASAVWPKLKERRADEAPAE